MALKQRLITLCSLTALVCGSILIYEFWMWDQTRKYNTAIAQAQFEEAESFMGDYGLFAQAYAAQQQGEYQNARIIYSTLESAENEALRLAAVFNMGNTFLQQASAIDIETDTDLALPLIELAKLSYREVLSIDSQQWDARYNLERALQLQPDSREQRLIDVVGRRRTVRTVVTPDPEEDLP